MAYKIDASLGALNASQSSSQLVRTSTGNLYTVISTSGDIRIYKSTDSGKTWGQKDYLNVPPAGGTLLAAAIDGNDTIHIAFGNAGVQYVPFSTSTDTYGRVERISTLSLASVAVAVDSNNIPHVAFGQSITTIQASYANRIGGVWSPVVTVQSSANSATSTDIQIDQNNVPQISYALSNNNIVAAIGNKNNASSFTTANVKSGGFTVNGGTSIAIDAAGNTWLAYQEIRDGRVFLTKHIQTNAWATWQSAVTGGFNGRSVSLAADANDIYVFYERNLGGIAYDRYDTVNGSWLGEQIIQTNMSRSTTNLQYHNPFVKWSQYFNNGDTGANNQNQDTIEYLFDDGSTVYYDKLITAQVSTGLAEIKFAPAGATTTSTSSTSSSTSTSISTSSTSASTSISTSSTSSSISTSTSFSTSSTSQSTSISTSISSTSSSISTSSTSRSTSTSSTSSSISTSSTSSSISTSTSISTSSTSASTSQSTSTSSTSTSISTSSTSRSTSTSSTSSSISTSSTSQSTSTSSTSSSISTSTSQSTSTSVSTSTSSTSSSTSLSTSSTSSSVSTSSTSRSTSTSSTSSSTSQTITTTSTSSTSSSTSTSASTSISTSSTSRSTSTSSSISTSSTSSSISTSTSHSTSSTSISTSSTSQSTSTSTTLIDVNTIPRAHIPNISMRYRIYREKIAIKRTRGRT